MSRFLVALIKREVLAFISKLKKIFIFIFVSINILCIYFVLAIFAKFKMFKIKLKSVSVYVWHILKIIASYNVSIVKH
jgi:hypothetical protein